MLGAVKVSKGRYTDRICFPIILRGELLGVDARDLTGSATAKYIRTKDSTCKDNWLYPFDVVKPMLDHLEKRYVILAEGIFHSLNAVDKGFPCLNFFGCHNFTRKKLLMLLDLDLDFVVFWRDNDKAGLVAEQIVCSMVSQYFPVYIANTDNVPEGMDLGDLPDYLIQYGIENLHEPVLPKCLEGTNGVKPRLDNKPYELCMQDCPYSMNGLCMNIPWHKEVKSEP
jgi:DNA primase